MCKNIHDGRKIKVTSFVNYNYCTTCKSHCSGVQSSSVGRTVCQLYTYCGIYRVLPAKFVVQQERAVVIYRLDAFVASVSRSSASQCDDVTDLNIEDDDRLVYGEAQYPLIKTVFSTVRHWMKKFYLDCRFDHNLVDLLSC